MDVLAAYREVGSYRGAAQICLSWQMVLDGPGCCREAGLSACPRRGRRRARCRGTDAARDPHHDPPHAARHQGTGGMPGTVGNSERTSTLNPLVCPAGRPARSSLQQLLSTSRTRIPHPPTLGTPTTWRSSAFIGVGQREPSTTHQCDISALLPDVAG